MIRNDANYLSRRYEQNRLELEPPGGFSPAKETSWQQEKTKATPRAEDMSQPMLDAGRPQPVPPVLSTAGRTAMSLDTEEMGALPLFQGNAPPGKGSFSESDAEESLPARAQVLRPHQTAAIEMARQSIRDGKIHPILAAPTSFGKTLVGASMLKSCQDKGKRGIFICDRIKLVSQTIETFRRMGLNFGVMQGQHELANPDAPIQIASVQTLGMRKRIPEFDLAIVDESHITFQTVIKMMERYDAVPFIGLSATPFSKGLGKYYDNLLVPITPRELLEQGYLCPVRYFGGHHIDLSNAGSKAIRTGGSDYDPSAIQRETEKDTVLVGDIFRNWQAKAEGLQTIAFSPSIKTSKWLVEYFQGKGVSAAHIDGYMPEDQRKPLFDAHDSGEIKILSCSQLLNTGYDAPTVRCLIDLYPTKSIIQYVQRIGRIMRIAEGKECAIYLDHAGNFSRFGYAEDIVPDSLDDGTHQFNERSQIQEKKEPKISTCPVCGGMMAGVKCRSCGYEIPIQKALETSGGDLFEITEGTKNQQKMNRKMSSTDKAVFYGELKYFAAEHNYRKGWADRKYKERLGVFPNAYKRSPTIAPSAETLAWIRHTQIKWAKRRSA